MRLLAQFRYYSVLKYLDYVCASHGWFEEMRGPGKHYRVWTENEVVDVIACEPPAVDLTSAPNLAVQRTPPAATVLVVSKVAQGGGSAELGR